MGKKVVLCIALLLCLTVTAGAEIQSGAFTLSPFYGGHLFDGAQSLDNSDFWGFGLGYNLDQRWALEGVYTNTEGEADAATANDVKVKTLRLDTLYHFKLSDTVVPYAAAGLGGIFSNPDQGKDKDHFLVSYGVGVKYFILDHLIALRADVRHLLDFPEPNHNLQYSAGLVFQFGRAAP